MPGSTARLRLESAGLQTPGRHLAELLQAELAVPPTPALSSLRGASRQAQALGVGGSSGPLPVERNPLLAAVLPPRRGQAAGAAAGAAAGLRACKSLGSLSSSGRAQLQPLSRAPSVSLSEVDKYCAALPPAPRTLPMLQASVPRLPTPDDFPPAALLPPLVEDMEPLVPAGAAEVLQVQHAPEPEPAAQLPMEVAAVPEPAAPPSSAPARPLLPESTREKLDGYLASLTPRTQSKLDPIRHLLHSDLAASGPAPAAPGPLRALSLAPPTPAPPTPAVVPPSPFAPVPVPVRAAGAAPVAAGGKPPVAPAAGSALFAMAQARKVQAIADHPDKFVVRKTPPVSSNAARKMAAFVHYGRDAQDDSSSVASMNTLEVAEEVQPTPEEREMDEYNHCVNQLKDVFDKKGKGALRFQFQSLDQDGRGVIGKDALAAEISKFNLGVKNSALMNMMEAVDVDHDGRIDYNEFCDAIVHGRIPFKKVPGRKLRMGPDPDQPFGHPTDVTRGPWGIMSDADRNVQQYHRPLQAQISHMKHCFSKFDQNRSGTVSFDMFSNAMKAMNTFLSDTDIKRLWRSADGDDLKGVIQYDKFIEQVTKCKVAGGGDSKTPLPEFMKPKSLRTSHNGNIWDWDTDKPPERLEVLEPLSRWV